jgi:hypothetical protein
VDNPQPETLFFFFFLHGDLSPAFFFWAYFSRHMVIQRPEIGAKTGQGDDQSHEELDSWNDRI